MATRTLDVSTLIPSTVNPSPQQEVYKTKQRELSEDRIFLGEGWFQTMTHVWCAIAVVTFMGHSISFKLSARKMNHWCRQPHDYGNLTEDEWKLLAIPFQETGGYSRCTMYDPPTLPNNTMNRSVIPCAAWDFDKTQYGNTIISQWSLVCNRGRFLLLAKIWYMAGAMFPVPILGIAADRAGRRPVLCGCAVILLIAGFASSLTTSYTFFIAARFVVSATSSAIMIIMIVMVHEVASPAKRVVYATVDILLVKAIVPIIFPLLAYDGISWNEVYLMVMVPTSFLVGIFYEVQESPRWLLVSWNLKSAEKMALLATKINGASTELARQSLNRAARRMQRLDHESDATKGPLLIAVSGLLYHPLHRKNSIILFGAWFSMVFTLYITSFNDILRYHKWVRTVYTAATVPVYTAVYFSMRQLGRKKTIIMASLTLSISSVLLGVIYSDRTPTFISSVLALLIRLSVKVAAGAIFIFTTELYPTMLRCIGLSSSFAMGRLGGIVGTLVVEFGPRHRTDIILLLIAFMMALGAVAMQLLPDTTTWVPKSVRTPSQHKKPVNPRVGPEARRASSWPTLASPLVISKNKKRDTEVKVPFNW